ncbi:hypothetical protein [Ascidiimonas aurantiaca]|uniref:hypothetical protein n=1 Tax=Ascidiimonas aurantiaca TaxID=1685432 RepID=UPI0030EE20C4
MKKNVLILAAVAVSFTLFSFRGIDKAETNAEISDFVDYNTTAATSFVESVETFPDKFTRARRVWVEEPAQQEQQLDQTEDVLARF